MADSAAVPQPRRGSQGVPTVRPLGNLPDRSGADMDRAQSFLRARQRPANDNGRGVLPTLANPALMQAANDNDSEDESADEYGAAQRESDERMRAMNAGYAGEDSGEEGFDQFDDQAYDADSLGEEAPSAGAEMDAEARDRLRAFEFNRQRAAQAAALRNNQETEEDEEEVAAKGMQEMAQKAAQRRLLKMEIGSTGVGLLVVWLMWNYEVFIERKAPTWKIFLVIMLDLLSILGLIMSFLWPLLLFISVLAVGREFLPESVRTLFDSIVSSVL